MDHTIMDTKDRPLYKPLRDRQYELSQAICSNERVDTNHNAGNIHSTNREDNHKCESKLQ